MSGGRSAPHAEARRSALRTQSRGAASRAVARWALRLFRREWRQQVLLLVLTTTAVAAAVAGSTMAVNAASDAPTGFGDAEGRIHLDGEDPAAVERAIASARSQFADVEVIAHTEVAVPGSVQPLDARDQQPGGPFGTPLLGRRSGRFPTGVDEVALTPGAAELFDAAIGSQVVVGDGPRTVVGIVENPDDLDDEFVLVAPGALPAPTSYTLLVGEQAAPGVRGPDGVGLPVETGDTAKEAVAATVLMASTLGMALVGLIAAGGFIVIAQRRQRQLGLLAAIGAGDRQVRLAVVTNGAIVGVVAGALGTVAGIGGWLAAKDAVESAAGHRIDRFDLPWTLIATIAGLAVLTAVAAAWWPARTASRLPVMAALSGRPAQPKPVHRSLVAGAVVGAAGVAGIVAGQPTGEHVRPFLLIGGLIGVVVGAVFTAPAAIRALGPVARRLPVAPRLALRDLARYQARAAAALAAITLGLGIATSVVVIAAANTYDDSEGNLATDQLLVKVAGEHFGPAPDIDEDDGARLDAGAAAVLDALGDGATAVPLDFAYGSPESPTANTPEPVTLGVAVDERSVRLTDVPYVATPEVLAAYGIDPATIDPDADVLTALEGTFVLVDPATRPLRGPSTATTQLVELPAQTSAPNALLTEAATARNGWTPVRAAWIVTAPHDLSGKEIRAARAAAADAGVAIEVRSSQDDLARLRSGATLVGALLAMAIVAMAVGLMRSEAARDLRTLVATGAPPRTRRALTASTAAALALLGALLGTVAAYIALVAAYHAELDRLVPVPVGNLLSLGVGLPLAAAAGGWLLAGAEPRAVARQVLD